MKTRNGLEVKEKEAAKTIITTIIKIKKKRNNKKRS
jgi:hypothetical protein